MRTHHREALGADEFIALGLIALAYGVALACKGYGFLAVFAAGLALRRIDEPTLRAGKGGRNASPRPDLSKISAADLVPDPNDSRPQAATSPQQAPAVMMLALERFNAQLERFTEVFIVLAVGALLTSVVWQPALLWFVPLMFLVVRPLAVVIGLLGTDVTGKQRVLMGWFGIRGIGSLYYLMYAVVHGVERDVAQTLVGLTLGVVVASIVAHGVSVTPLMKHYRAVTRRNKPRSAKTER